MPDWLPADGFNHIVEKSVIGISDFERAKICRTRSRGWLQKMWAWIVHYFFLSLFHTEKMASFSFRGTRERRTKEQSEVQRSCPEDKIAIFFVFAAMYFTSLRRIQVAGYEGESKKISGVLTYFSIRALHNIALAYHTNLSYFG